MYLGVGAVLGAVATALLVVFALGESAESGYSRSGSSTAARGEDEGRDRRRTGRVEVQRVDEERARRGNRTPYAALARPNQREPFDSPETHAKRAAMAAEILRLLDEIRAGDIRSASQNYARMQRLKKLVRDLNHRLPTATRDRLLGMFDTIDSVGHAMIGEVLGQLRGDVDTAKLLIARLQDKPDEVRTRLAMLNALRNMGVQEVVDDLGAMLGNNFANEQQIVQAINQIGGTKATETLLAYLERDAINTGTAREIERVLGRGAHPKVLAEVAENLASENPAKRRSMLNVLANARKPEYSEAVREMFAEETDPTVRRQAIRAMGMMGDLESTRVLMELANSGNEREKVHAIQALHTVKNPETVNKLAEDWNKLTNDQREAVMGAAARLPRPGDALAKVARDSIFDDNVRVRTKSVALLGKTRQDKHVDLIGSFLRGAKTDNERREAIRALERIGTEKAAEEVLRNIDAVPARQREATRRKFEQIKEKRIQLRMAAENRR